MMLWHYQAEQAAALQWRGEACSSYGAMEQTSALARGQAGLCSKQMLQDGTEV